MSSDLSKVSLLIYGGPDAPDSTFLRLFLYYNAHITKFTHLTVEVNGF